MFNQKRSRAPDHVNLSLDAVRIARVLIRQRNQHLRVVIVLQLNRDFVVLAEEIYSRCQTVVGRRLRPEGTRPA